MKVRDESYSERFKVNLLKYDCKQFDTVFGKTLV